MVTAVELERLAMEAILNGSKEDNILLNEPDDEIEMTTNKV
jgi:hypothetical protein